MNENTKQFSKEQISKLAKFVDFLINQQTMLHVSGLQIEERKDCVDMVFEIKPGINLFCHYMYSKMALRVSVRRCDKGIVLYGLNFRWEYHRGGENGHDIPGPYYFDEGINRLNVGTYVPVTKLNIGDKCEFQGVLAEFEGVELDAFGHDYAFTVYTEEHPEGQRRTLPATTYLLKKAAC